MDVRRQQCAARRFRPHSTAFARRCGVAFRLRHATGAGSRDRQSIPQSATVPRKNGPKFTPNFDGPPQYAAVADTSLSYVVNSSEPVIRVDPDAWYAVVAGVWFTAAQVTGPWTVATSVPAVIYTIPPSSPLHYVTYVRIYEPRRKCLRRVYAGLSRRGGRAVGHDRVRHRLCLLALDRIGLVSRPRDVHGRRRTHLQPVCRVHVRIRRGPRHRRLVRTVLRRILWCVLSPRLLGRLCVLRIGQRERVWPLGQRRLFRHAFLVCRRRRGGHHDQGQLRQQADRLRQQQRRKAVQRLDGNATRGYHRTSTTAAGGSANVARASNYNPYTGQRSTASGVTESRPMAARISARATTAGPLGDAHAGEGSTTTPPPARPTPGIRRASATSTMPTSMATSTGTTEAAGSSTDPAVGAARRATLPGPIRKRSRAAMATTGPAHLQARPIDSAVADSTAPDRVASAAGTAATGSPAVVAGGADLVEAAGEDSAAAAFRGGRR